MSAPEKNNLLAIPSDSLKIKDKNNKIFFYSQKAIHYLIFVSNGRSGFCEKINMPRLILLSLWTIYLIINNVQGISEPNNFYSILSPVICRY